MEFQISVHEGKEVFIKVVLQALSIYAMQCFEFPKTLCCKLEGLLNKFWWANNKSSKGIHWSNWSSLCKPKSIAVWVFVTFIFLINLF